MLIHYLNIGLGGALGAVTRVLLANALPSTIFRYIPLQILAINVLGCLTMGLLTGLMTFYWQPSINFRSFLTTGFLGGFTTFSAFALDFGLLIERGLTFYALLYVILSIVLSLSCFFLGLKAIAICS
jgi:CrcB protein